MLLRKGFFVLLALCGVLILKAASAQEKSVKPGINKAFENPEIKDFLKKFEGESREVAVHAKELVAACKLKPGMTIADVGAGTGFFTRRFAAEVAPEGKVFAVDIAPAFLRHIEDFSKKNDIKCADSLVRSVLDEAAEECDRFCLHLRYLPSFRVSSTNAPVDP